MEQTLGTLTIDRSKWLRGGKNPQGIRAESQMRDRDGNMCCLGFDAVARGCTVEALTCRETPPMVATRLNGGVPDTYKDYVGGVVYKFGDAMQINDNAKYLDTERESGVRAELIALGWSEVVFVDGPVNQ